MVDLNLPCSSKHDPLENPCCKSDKVAHIEKVEPLIYYLSEPHDVIIFSSQPT